MIRKKDLLTVWNSFVVIALDIQGKRKSRWENGSRVRRMHTSSGGRNWSMRKELER